MGTIPVVDLVSGEVTDRETETLTLDIPADLEPSAAGLVVDADRLGRYPTVWCGTRIYSAKPVYLSRRAAGEECLVAGLEVDSSSAVCTRRYVRSMVRP
jgi:hypothetical protein